MQHSNLTAPLKLKSDYTFDHSNLFVFDVGVNFYVLR